MSGDRSLNELAELAEAHQKALTFDFDDFVLSESSADMEARMLADKFV